MKTCYLAIDIGASSGRHILGTLEDGKLILQEVYRFENGMHDQDGHLCWDHEALFAHIKEGMRRCRQLGSIPVSLAIDTWGVDFVLLYANGLPVGQCVGYRDHRTDGIREKLEPIIAQQALYRRTGIQFQPYNTLNQLVALKEEDPGQLQEAAMLLMTPDYFNFRLTGKAMQEYTIASTSQMLDIHTGDWDRELIEMLGLPQKLFLPPNAPGTPVGALLPEVAQEVGFQCKVVMGASHDTASAVMAVPSMEEKALYISSGTWSLMGIESQSFSCTPESMAAGFTNEGGYAGSYRYLKNIMGLWMIQSVRAELAPHISYVELCDAAERETIPTLLDCNDERFLSPKSMCSAIEGYCVETGQPVPQTAAQFACVIYNSLAACYARTKEQIQQLTGLSFDRIYIIGGGSQASYLNRLTAKYAGCRVCAGPVEATAIGSLLCQMLEDRRFSSLAEARQCVIDSFRVECF